MLLPMQISKLQQELDTIKLKKVQMQKKWRDDAVKHEEERKRLIVSPTLDASCVHSGIIVNNTLSNTILFCLSNVCSTLRFKVRKENNLQRRKKCWRPSS